MLVCSRAISRIQQVVLTSIRNAEILIVAFVLVTIVAHFLASPTNLATWTVMMTFVLQSGTSEFEDFKTAVPTGDGSTILAGVTFGSWNGSNTGSGDFSAVKLYANGSVNWKWQVSQERDSPGCFLSLNSLESTGGGRSCGLGNSFSGEG